MTSFYSIVQVPIRPAGQEHLNIGLLFVDGTTCYFRFSNRKLEIVKKLIPVSSFNILRSYLFGLGEQLKIKDEKLKFLGNPEFINYLADYNNNLITFSKPTPIDLEVNDSNYHRLFEKFIFSYEEEMQTEPVQHSVTIASKLKSELYPKIKKRVNLNLTLTTKEIPTLLIPSVKVSFIGQNHVPVAGQGVDFEKSTEVITNGISRLISLIKAFDMEGEKGQYYIIGREPNKELFKEQHDNWAHIRSTNLIKFVDIDETEVISDYIISKGVKPFVGN